MPRSGPREPGAPIGVPRQAPRRYGLAATSILAADAVTAGSQAVRADRTHNPDLLAVRGACTCARPGVRPNRGATHR
jgi:hypothetical protein